MKKATHKILMAAASLVIALGVASGTTFAWFTANRTVSVGSINATVTSGNDGLYIAIKKTDGTFTDFKTSLSTSDITSAIYSGSGSVELDALTSLTYDGGNKVFTSTNTKGSTLTAENGVAQTFDGTAEKNKYVELTLKFRTGVSQNIFLAQNNGTDSVGNRSEIIPGTGDLTYVKAWAAIDADTYNTSSYAKNANLETRAAYATRVAFISNEGTPKKNVWAPYEVTDADGFTDAAGFYEGNCAEDYRQNFLSSSAVTPGTATKTTVLNDVVMLSDADAQNKTKGSAVELGTTTDSDSDGVYEVELTIKIWIEGTDGDCFNSIFSDTITVNFIFNSIPA